MPKGKAKAKQAKAKAKAKAKQAHRKSAASTSSGPYLLQHVIINILSALPVKTLLRFQCVCKEWRRLIFLPFFTSEHLNRCPTSLLIYAHRTDVTITDESETLDHDPIGHVISIYEPPNPNRNRYSTVRVLECPGWDSSTFKQIEMVGSSNGVVCVVQRPSVEHFALWNPTTGACKHVPFPNLRANSTHYPGLSAGIAFDSHSKEYKIIRILCQKGVGMIAAEVYSSRSRLWRFVKWSSFFYFNVEDAKCGAVIRGVPYWEAVAPCSNYRGVQSVFAYFNTQMGVLETMPKAWESETAEIMGEIKGSLGVIVPEKKTETLDVWRLNEGVWSSIYKVESMPVVGKVLGLYGDRGILVQVGVEGNFLMYNCEKKEVEDLINVENALPKTFSAIGHMQTLVRVPAHPELV